MRFKERNDLANRCKEWMIDQLENNITTPLDTVHMVLAYLDVNGYLNEVVRCSECMWSRIKQTKYCKYMICDLTNIAISEVYPQDFYCAFGERREDRRSNQQTGGGA